jgi:hypothetical protein
VSIEEVRALVAERQRYDSWLTALEAKRTAAPPRVFERVSGDYVARRAEVMARLQSHIGNLALFGEQLERRLADLELRLAAHEEELAEGMLRNLVGEYDDDRWNAARREIETTIAALGGERGALVSEVEDVRALLTSARVPQQPEAATLSAPAVNVAAPPAGPPPDDVLTGFEALFKTSIGEVAPPPGSASVSTTIPERDMVTHQEVEDALAMFGEATAPAEPQFVESLSGIQPDHDAPADPFDDLAFLRSVVDAEKPGTLAAPPSSSASGQAPAAAIPGDPRKSLRCSECGTMNLPTEWYCERCGGELAAI